MKLFTTALLSLFTLLAWQAPLQAETYQAGVDYDVFEQPGKVEVPGKLEVREFFWFGCPHCFQLEEPLAQWRKKQTANDVNFVRTPAPMNDNWLNHAHAYYVAETMDQTDAISTALFNAIHVKNQTVFTQDQLAAFFVPFGITEEEFNKRFNSFAVRVKVRQAGSLAKTYRLRGVPALVINGKYLVKSMQGGSSDSMLRIVDFLLDKERVGQSIIKQAQ